MQQQQQQATGFRPQSHKPSVAWFCKHKRSSSGEVQATRSAARQRPRQASAEAESLRTPQGEDRANRSGTSACCLEHSHQQAHDLAKFRADVLGAGQWAGSFLRGLTWPGPSCAMLCLDPIPRMALHSATELNEAARQTPCLAEAPVGHKGSGTAADGCKRRCNGLGEGLENRPVYAGTPGSVASSHQHAIVGHHPNRPDRGVPSLLRSQVRPNPSVNLLGRKAGHLHYSTEFESLEKSPQTSPSHEGLNLAKRAYKPMDKR